MLCEFVDDFVPDTIEHVIAVPRADLSVFKTLANSRRRVTTQEELLPAWLRRIPLPGPTLRRVFGLPQRNLYFTPRPRIVRGWIVQQLMKLRAAATATSDIVLHADSDMAFIRPLKLELIVQQGRVRLYRRPGHGNDPMHRPWHAAASKLLGLPPSNYHGSAFIENLIAWRRDCVAHLLQRISEVVETDPMEALAATNEFAEYILYGVFCERILTLESSGHFASPVSLCKTAWSRDGLEGLMRSWKNLRSFQNKWRLVFNPRFLWAFPNAGPSSTDWPTEFHRDRNHAVRRLERNPIGWNRERSI